MERYGDLRKIVTPYRPGPGHFAKIKGVSPDGLLVAGQWFWCRDLWHFESRKVRLFLYSHLPCKGRAIVSFLRQFEDIVKVQPLSKFGPTQRKTVTWIEQSKWWTSSMRRSLFTLLMRASVRYNFENFYEALYSIEMTRETRPAIERFMAGHTSYRGNRTGWYSQFGRNLSLEQLEKLLV